MTIYLIRHGKSDKSLQDVLPHDEFELKRELIAGEAEKAHQLGEALREDLGPVRGYDLVFSGKLRSKQTVMAIASGMGLSETEIAANLREDFGLIYLAEQQYWHDCEQAVKDGSVVSHADFFLENPPTHGQTFTAEYMRHNMRHVLRRAIERNVFLKRNVSVMVSHEPVLSLCMSDLCEKNVSELGGSFAELEQAKFSVSIDESTASSKVLLKFRGETYDVSGKIFGNE